MKRLVLLAGWGCDARIWELLAPHLPEGWEIHTPDWPGYAGREALADPTSIAALAEAMADDLPQDAVWVGWSLGGLLAGALLDHLPAPAGVILLGMGPRFCHPCGITAGELAAFRRAFLRDPAAALIHFRRWQLAGEPAPLLTHRRLRDLLGDALNADTLTLAAGLDWLATLDVERPIAEVPCPVHRLVGANDPLLAPSLREAADRCLDDAGHCPMLSRPRRLADVLTALARECHPAGGSAARHEAYPT
ncbi:alpha/beta fold hydrolase [Billgrantia gudaonensis]|uniref:Carboxylesterase BioH (Pimeloyl-CoA synthesis) n=1 Tax=Billgrantia gudaonensis TaxID=376427 RepID=A0A1G8TH66_9GAMM|nr:alpha/beta fold hydrolase [Halomonas gudaonensis]SDJ40916.1 carboxylesterase BioH (pimeloyl-CoA synthesis) [Halomonas gudaonensis]